MLMGAIHVSSPSVFFRNLASTRSNYPVFFVLLHTMLLSACGNAVEEVSNNIPPQKPSTEIDPKEKYFSSPRAIKFLCHDINDDCKATYFSTDGSDPQSIPENRYQTPIHINTENTFVTLKYFSEDNSGLKEPIKSVKLLLDTQGPILSVSPEGGIFSGTKTITFTCEDGIGVGCGNIFYTTDDSVQDLSQFTRLSDIGGLSINTSANLRVYAVDLLDNVGEIKEYNYQFDNASPNEVNNLKASIGDNRILLSWINPTLDFEGVTIRRSTLEFPQDINSGDIIYDGKGEQFIDENSSNPTNITNGTRYFYRLYTYDQLKNYSAGVDITAIPTSITVNPNPNSTDVAPTTTISASFDVDLQVSSLDINSFQLMNTHTRRLVSGALQFDPGNPKLASFQPIVPFPLAASYDVTLSKSIKDQLSNTLEADFTWSFQSRDGIWNPIVHSLDLGNSQVVLKDSAIDANGNITVVWWEKKTGLPIRDILFVSRYDNARGWGNWVTNPLDVPTDVKSPVIVQSSVTNDMINNIKLAVDNDGNVLIFYTKTFSGSPMYAVNYNVNTSWDAWGNTNTINEIIVSDTISGDTGKILGPPVVTFDSNNNAIVVWAQENVPTNPTKTNIWTNRFESNNVFSNWNGDTAKLITSSTGTSKGFSSTNQPAVVADTVGNVFFAWEEQDSVTNKNGLWATYYDVSSPWATWQPGDLANIVDNDIGDVTSFLGDENLAMDDNGNVILVWLQSDGKPTPEINMWAKRFDSTNSWPNFVVSPAIQLENSILNPAYLKLKMDKQGNAIVVWKQSLDKFSEALLVNRYDVTKSWNSNWNATTTKELDLVANATEPEHFSQVEMDVNSNGTTIVTWSKNEATATGRGDYIWGNNFNISTGWDLLDKLKSKLLDPNPIYLSKAEISIDNNDNAMIIWSDINGNILYDRYTSKIGWDNWQPVSAELIAYPSPAQNIIKVLSDDTGVINVLLQNSLDTTIKAYRYD